MEILKQLHPIARKEHTCMLCGCKIKAGEKYTRQTIVNDDIYDFVCHEECDELTQRLDMYDDGDGITGVEFGDTVLQYLYDNFYDKETKCIQAGIKKLSTIEQVRFILNDLNEKEKK